MEIISLSVGMMPTNCYIAASDEKNAAVIDPGGDPEKILRVLESRGWTARKVLLTHGHFDHVGAVKALQAAGALRLGACELRALSDSRNQAEPASSDTPYLFCPMTGSDGDTLSFGGVSFVADGDYKTILYASPELKAGESLQVSNGRSSVTAVVK